MNKYALTYYKPVRANPNASNITFRKIIDEIEADDFVSALDGVKLHLSLQRFNFIDPILVELRMIS